MYREDPFAGLPEAAREEAVRQQRYELERERQQLQVELAYQRGLHGSLQDKDFIQHLELLTDHISKWLDSSSS